MQYTPEQEAAGRALLAKGEGLLSQTRAAQAPTPTSQPPIKDLYGSVSQNDNYIDTSTSYYKNIAETPVNEQEIRNSTMRALQAEIDATNRLYADKLKEAQQQGLGRIGSGNAIQARRGLIGSDFGTAQGQEIINQNNQIEGGIRNENALAISAIVGRGNKMAQEEIAAKNAARQQGAEAYLKYLSESDARRNTRTTEAAQRALAAGYDLSTADDASIKAIADSYQISPNTLRTAFSELQAAQAAAAREAEAKQLDLEGKRFTVQNQGRILDADLALKNLDALYKKAQIAKTDAERAKTFAEIGKLEAEVQASGNTNSTPAGARTAINLVKNSLANARALSGASGRSGARRSAEAWFVGATDYSNLVAETNTLRTNVLTLATDPSIKKFFGPQMSNADVQLMTSAGTTLNPELQSPEKLLAEISRLDNLIGRMEKALPVDQQTPQGNIITAPDGTQVELID